jgi:uncharacterized protein (UPF0548 family)
MSKTTPLHMWIAFLEGVIRLWSTGTASCALTPAISTMSRSLVERLLGQRGDARRTLAEMHQRRPSFDPSLGGSHTSEHGWHSDDVRRALPNEPPGDPVPNGSWETARRIARDYDFAEPSIVQGVFDRAEPLENRTMLLILRFHALRIEVGVRVGDVYDERRQLDGRSGRVFGWNYRTLEGHVEQGQMDWQVWKFPDTGEVLFRICAVSKRGPRWQSPPAAGLQRVRETGAAAVSRADRRADETLDRGAVCPARAAGIQLGRHALTAWGPESRRR